MSGFSPQWHSERRVSPALRFSCCPCLASLRQLKVDFHFNGFQAQRLKGLYAAAPEFFRLGTRKHSSDMLDVLAGESVQTGMFYDQPRVLYCYGKGLENRLHDPAVL